MSSNEHRLYLRQPFSVDKLVLSNHRCWLSVGGIPVLEKTPQEVIGKFQDSPRKKAQGQDLALAPVK